MADAHDIVEAVEDIDPLAWSALEQLGRTLHVKGAEIGGTLVAILNEAVSLTEGTRYAGVNLLVKGRFEPQAVLGEAPLPLDAWQQRKSQGPCVEASRDQKVVRVADMGTDPRWPGFRELAVSKGVQAMLCLPLWVDETRLGSLSLYAERAREFDERTTRVGTLLATHAALAVADALRAENLRAAVQNRDVIGQAKGILMERHRLTAEQAFARLVDVSQRSNRKLAEVARGLADTGSIADD